MNKSSFDDDGNRRHRQNLSILCFARICKARSCFARRTSLFGLSVCSPLSFTTLKAGAIVENDDTSQRSFVLCWYSIYSTIWFRCILAEVQLTSIVIKFLFGMLRTSNSQWFEATSCPKKMLNAKFQVPCHWRQSAIPPLGNSPNSYSLQTLKLRLRENTPPVSAVFQRK